MGMSGLMRGRSSITATMGEVALGPMGQRAAFTKSANSAGRILRAAPVRAGATQIAVAIAAGPGRAPTWGHA